MQKFAIKLTEETSTGFVYVVQAGNESLYKIGWTQQDPKIRLSSLQVGNHVKLKLIYVFSACSKSLEKRLHDIFRNSCVSGEWFKLNTADILDITDPDRRMLLL